MILLHPSVRLPLYFLAGVSTLVGLAVLGLAATNGFPFSLIWRGLLALAVGVIALRLGMRHTARAPSRKSTGG